MTHIEPASSISQFYTLNSNNVPNNLSAKSIKALIAYINRSNRNVSEKDALDWSLVFSKSNEHTCQDFCKTFKSFFSESDYRYVAELIYDELKSEVADLSKIKEGKEYIYQIGDGDKMVAEELLSKFEPILLKSERYQSAALSIIFEFTDISYYDFIELDNGNVLAIHGDALKLQSDTQPLTT